MRTKKSSIPYQETGYFSGLICDYLDQLPKVSQFYGRFPSLEAFKGQLKEKEASYTDEKRKVLTGALARQYRGFEVSARTEENLALLERAGTFTVTTGHQLNLFTGPLYFLYKIISTINLCRDLKSRYPDNDFVPVYWMATEDHDFEEIQFFNFKGKRIEWQRESSGPVGRMSLEGMEEVYGSFSGLLGNSRSAEALRQMFRKAYLDHRNLSDATRYLANNLFSGEGLVILDGDDRELKTLFTPFVRKELEVHKCSEEVEKTNSSLQPDYNIQVTPREINLFYLEDNLRERLIQDGESWKVNRTGKSFDREGILREIQEHPERFSPNALMRPLYQEVVLPNLCYIGGGGEIAYWLQLKGYFDSLKVPFPVLLLRNSALLIDQKQQKKLERLGITDRELFLDREELIRRKVLAISEIEIDLSKEAGQLRKMFGNLRKLAKRTDKSFLGAVQAQEKKQMNGLHKLEKRLLKAQKRQYQERVDRIAALHESLFPKQGLQERQANFSEFYEEYGADLVQALLDTLDPLDLQFDLLRL